MSRKYLPDLKTLWKFSRTRRENHLLSQLAQLKKDLSEAVSSPPATLMEFKSCLEKITTSATEMADSLNLPDSDPKSSIGYWAKAFANQSMAALDELRFFAPWIFYPQLSDMINELPKLNDIMTLKELTDFYEEFQSATEEIEDLCLQPNSHRLMNLEILLRSPPDAPER